VLVGIVVLVAVEVTTLGVPVAGATTALLILIIRKVAGGRVLLVSQRVREIRVLLVLGLDLEARVELALRLARVVVLVAVLIRGGMSRLGGGVSARGGLVSASVGGSSRMSGLGVVRLGLGGLVSGRVLGLLLLALVVLLVARLKVHLDPGAELLLILLLA